MTESFWTSEMQVSYPLITETALSPDATRVVYAVREALMTEDESRYLTQLYLVPVAGGDPLQLTWGRHSNRAPQWSPDGRFVAFLSDRPLPKGMGHGSADSVDSGQPRTNLFVMRADGGEPWALTAYGDTDVIDVRWSPDGSQLAFLMDEPPTEEKAAAKKAKDDVVLWDEEFDFRHLYIVPFVDMPRQLPEALQVTGGRMQVVTLAWLPDGRSLALTTQPTPNADDWPETRLVRVPASLPEGGVPYGPDDVLEIAMVRAGFVEPAPSPDGAWIACVTGDEPPRWAVSNGIVLYAVDGGDGHAPARVSSRPLWRGPEQQCWPIGWSDDAQTVYAMEFHGLDSHIWALPVSGEPGHLLLSTETYKFAASWMCADTFAYAEETFTQPNRLMVWCAGSAPAEVGVPPLPADWPAEKLPAVDVLHWQGPDGLPIEGFVTFPFGYQPGDHCPLVVHVHGGPTGVFLRRYPAWPDRQCDTLALAEQGIAVLRANPRGSSGYGRDFRFANYGDWGGGDFADIMAGVDLLIERGIADPDRLGIMGWSYGGYMTSWAITQTDRFKAACVGAGVTNLMSFTGTADIPSFIPDYFDGEYWDDLATYMRHSAMGHVKDITTPTLVQHGDSDIRVPPGQGREFYNALKRQGVETQMVFYPRQGHGINEPRLRADVRKRSTDWMVRWLKRDSPQSDV